jgi:NAD(P)-dependent dehydrogenase (short-subunit alcohol dehydrogenase family)
MDAASRSVLVTGGAGGLGRVLARTFAEAGYAVAITGRTETRLKSTADEIRRRGGTVRYFVCDVTSQSDVERLERDILRDLGSLQILLNNAGIARAARFLDMSHALWQEILQTNLTGAYNCSRVFLPGMIRDKWGRIINIASTAAKVGYPYVAAYTASKHGILGLTRALALETARSGITVNAICPGYLNNERTRDNARRMAEETGRREEDILGLFAATAPQNRLIEPEEVASLALLLAGDKCAAITGQAINIDGGTVMI